MKHDLILAIDQGTSGSKAVLFNTLGDIISDGRAPLASCYPQEGYVEQKGDEIYSSVLLAVGNSISEAEKKGYSRESIRCCGISNQRETFLLWDKEGKLLHNAVVWQCKRSIDLCIEMKSRGLESLIREKTGLFLDPYFSGTKVSWLAEHDEIVNKALAAGDAFFGTVDTWLLYSLSHGREFKTDYTNASRTMLFNIKTLQWDRDLLEVMGLQGLNLPEARPSSSCFGHTDFDGILAKTISVNGMLGDSHAAAFGERCFHPGDAKATLGTGSSILMNTGEMVLPQKTTMVSTICWSTEEIVSYALEGIIVSCGSTLNWISSALGFFESGKEADDIAMNLENNGNVYLIPAFSGLGAPWWKMEEKGQIQGLTFGSDKNHIVRAGLESIAYQITDVIHAMKNDSGSLLNSLQIDGGLSSSPFIQKMLSALLPLNLYRCTLKEASAMGAALMAGLGFGLYKSIAHIEKLSYDRESVKQEENPLFGQTYSKWLEIIKKLG